MIPGNEKKLYKLQNLITKKDINLITEENAFVHVSGHPNRDDLKDMYSWIKPNCVIPVHGEHRHMKEHISFSKEMQVPYSLQVENGDIIKLMPSRNAKIVDKAPSGKMYLDGEISVNSESRSIKERRSLASNGYLEVTIIISNSGKLTKPIISFKGIPNKEEDVNDIIFDMEGEIHKVCKSFSLENKKQEKNLIESIKNNCRRLIKDKTGKKPYTNINIARL